ncbi:MAG: cytosine permease [Arthrobacter sp.]|nr:cytosine permease [Arthrobacter sp.]
MSSPSSPAPPSQRPRLIETAGIEIIPESARTAKPRQLFWPWFAANVSVFGMSYGSFVLGFGISFWQATIVSVVGIVVSFALCGLVAIAGKRGSAPTMVLSRAAFGVEGNKVPGIVSWLVSIGWETSLAITAVLATSTIFERLGLDGGTATKLVATIVVAALIVGASVLGYHTIMKLQSWLTWITGLITVLYLILALPHVDLSAVAAVPNGSLAHMIGALVMVMTGFGLGWINIAADWSRYQRRDAPDGAIVAWNTLGGAAAPIILVVVGLLLAASDQGFAEAVGGDPVGALASILPTGILIPFLITAILALVSGAVLGIYSSGLTLLSLGIKMPRPAAAGIDGVILTLGTIFVVFVAQDFIGPFQSFLITLGVPLASWAGLLIADVLRRKRPYAEADLFDKRGRYGSWDLVSLATLVVTSVIGWGLVVNTFAEAAAWNNWQGYLLGPLGLGGREGDWAYANVGVLLALVLSFLVGYFLRAPKIAAQEALPVPQAQP